MSKRKVDGFFYGLFMDLDILRKAQVKASNPRRAYVSDFALRIGHRATLLPTSGAKSYGMLYSLTFDDLDTLYNGPGLEQYRPEAVLAHSFDGACVPALCYNLTEAPKPNETNEAYTAQLRKVLLKLEFPVEYIASMSIPRNM